MIHPWVLPASPDVINAEIVLASPICGYCSSVSPPDLAIEWAGRVASARELSAQYALCVTYR